MEDDEWSDDLSDMMDEWEDGDLDAMDARRGRGNQKARVIKLFGKRRFEYSFLEANASQFVVVRRSLRAVPFYYLWLLVRVHNVSVQGSAANITLRCWNTLPSKQDPQEFTIGGTAPLSVQALPSTTAGTLLSDTANNQGPFLKAELEFHQGATAGQRLYAELSAVLYGRAVG